MKHKTPLGLTKPTRKKLSLGQNRRKQLTDASAKAAFFHGQMKVQVRDSVYSRRSMTRADIIIALMKYGFHVTIQNNVYDLKYLLNDLEDDPVKIRWLFDTHPFRIHVPLVHFVLEATPTSIDAMSGWNKQTSIFRCREPWYIHVDKDTSELRVLTDVSGSPRRVSVLKCLEFCISKWNWPEVKRTTSQLLPSQVLYALMAWYSHILRTSKGNDTLRQIKPAMSKRVSKGVSKSRGISKRMSKSRAPKRTSKKKLKNQKKSQKKKKKNTKKRKKKK